MPRNECMKNWADYRDELDPEDDRFGRWRDVNILTDASAGFVKKTGLLVLKGKKWDLYFYLDQPGYPFDIDIMNHRLWEHPFVDNIELDPEKPKGGHLSTRNVGVRTKNNVAQLGGYSKHNDSLDHVGQMTHAWLQITKGLAAADFGGWRNQLLTANLLCEVCGFKFPFPELFSGDVSMERPAHVAVGTEGLTGCPLFGTPPPPLELAPVNLFDEGPLRQNVSPPPLPPHAKKLPVAIPAPPPQDGSVNALIEAFVGNDNRERATSLLPGLEGTHRTLLGEAQREAIMMVHGIQYENGIESTALSLSCLLYTSPSPRDPE